MSLEFILIDFENVQLKNIGLLKPGACRIKVFLGQNQSKLLLELVQALQPFGSDAEYIQIAGSGPNALDFHIAFYIGRLSKEHPDGAFTIISKDTGFDPLVKHLASLGIKCRRLGAIPAAAKASATARVQPKAAAPAKATAPAAAKAKPSKNVVVTVLPEAKGKPKPAKAAAVPDPRVDEVIVRLKGLKTAKPVRLKTLESSIKSWFKPVLATAEVAAVVQSMVKLGKIKVEGTKVAYALD